MRKKGSEADARAASYATFLLLILSIRASLLTKVFLFRSRDLETVSTLGFDSMAPASLFGYKGVHVEELARVFRCERTMGSVQC